MSEVMELDLQSALGQGQFSLVQGINNRFDTAETRFQSQDDLLAMMRLRARLSLNKEFKREVNRWIRDTAFVSSVSKQVLNPAYQRIIGMGKRVVPLLLRELKERPNYWFWALTAITGKDPTAGKETFQEGVDAWLTWGHSRGLI